MQVALPSGKGRSRSNPGIHLVGMPALLFLFALLCSLSVYSQQTMRVRGHVVNEANEPVPDASVVATGANGVTTDASGNFEITVPSDATLMISSVGYAAQNVEVNNRSTINITLSANIGSLEDVVVVGYGTQRKEAVTGSVASISGSAMREVPAPNITQALQGRLPGVDISQTDSKPGSSMQIRVRGTRSLNASNDPLIVLDGIPFVGSIADINPTDIKSIDILKDASATAIYGSRGANGVILVTTNRGNRNQKPRVSYNAYYGNQKIFSKYPMMDGPEFVALRQTAGLYTNGADESDDVNIDWQDLFYRTGVLENHDVGLAGGTETGSYSFGLGYYHNQGVIPTQQYNRYSLRFSLDQNVGKYLKFGLSTNSNYNVSEGSQIGLYNVLSASPIANPYNADGTLKRTIKMPLDEQFVITRGVVEGLQDQWLNENRGFASYNAIYGEVQIPGVTGLKYRANLGLDYVQNNIGAYTGQGVNSTNPETESTASVDNRHTYHWTMENILSYDRTFAKKHSVNVVGLYSSEQNKYVRSSMAARDIPSDAFQFYNLGQAAGELTIDPNNQDYQVWGLMSWMGRVMYAYDNRYLVSATIRSDASSRLAEGHKWHTYPAVSVGWNIANEDFMRNNNLINALKLRVGYGETSNQAIAPYATLGRLSTRPYNFGDATYSTGYYVTQLPNSNLGWEYSQTWNAGVDFTLLNNRLSGTLEYYVTNTKDLLLSVGLPSTSGVTSYTANIGQTQNKGIELSLNGTVIDNLNGWNWEVGVNIYGNRNKLVALASGQKRDEGNAWFVGHNINAIYDYKRIGLWQDKDPYLDVLEPGGNAGMIKVEYTGDYNPDGTPARAIGPDDRQILDVDPKFQGGFNTRVSYKGFDLTMVAAFKSGGILVSTLNGPYSYLNLESGRRNNIKIDYWKPDNTDAKYPKPGGIMSSDNPKYASTLGYFDGSYLKMRTISLGYNFAQSPLLKNSRFANLRIYITAQNPFVAFSDFTKETGLDPETNSYGDQNIATGGYQNRLLTVGYNTPSTRNYLVGINLTF